MNSSHTYSYDASQGLIFLPGEIVGPLRSEAISFVFDPGAFRTMVSTELTDYLGYHASGTSQKISADSVIGREHGCTLRLKKLTILGFDFSEIDVACFDLPEGVDALLGLDVLRHFEITLRHADHWISFAPIN